MERPAATWKDAGAVRLHGGTLLRGGGLQQLDLVLAGERIVALLDPGAAAGAERVVDVSGRLVLPGFVDAHTHSYAQLCRDAVADDHLEPWLPSAVAASAGLSAEAVAVAAQLSALDALRHGATTTLDHATLGEGHAEALVGAYRETGTRVALAAQVADVPFADSLHGVPGALRDAVRDADPRVAPGTDEQLERCRELIAAAGAGGQVTVLLGPSAPERCTGALLDAVSQLADEHDLGLHVHLLETRQQRAGGDPLGTLCDHGLVRSRLSVAHGVHLDARDLDRLAAARAAVIHNPMSNLGLGSGRLDLRALLDAGITVGLGCDGWTTGGGQDVLAQARLALVGRRPDDPPGRWLRAEEVWPLVAEGGAHALGAGGVLGVLEVGAHADLLLVDPVRAGLVEGVDTVAQLLLGGLGPGLREAWVAGRPVLRDGLPLLFDAERLMRRAAELLPALRAAARPLQATARDLAALLRRAAAAPPGPDTRPMETML